MAAVNPHLIRCHYHRTIRALLTYGFGSVVIRLRKHSNRWKIWALDEVLIPIFQHQQSHIRFALFCCLTLIVAFSSHRSTITRTIAVNLPLTFDYDPWRSLVGILLFIFIEYVCADIIFFFVWFILFDYPCKSELTFLLLIAGRHYDAWSLLYVLFLPKSVMLMLSKQSLTHWHVFFFFFFFWK